MNILVTGKNGQLVRSLVEVASRDPDSAVMPVGRPELDLAEPSTILPVVDAYSPDLIVSAAAYTAVDRAETEPELARSVNVQGPAELARTADRLGIPIIHISTDYVFSGEKPSAYNETDEPFPLSVYGQTKLEGERAVQSYSDRCIILRTSWVYSHFGSNFLKAMLKFAANGNDPVRVVADQFGSPTSALDLAEAILQVARMLRHDRYGTFHVCDRGTASRADFARCIFAASTSAGGPAATVEDILAQDYPAPAPRPRNSSLACNLFERTFAWQMPDWQKSVWQTTRRIVRSAYLRA